jgi:hypothetical protein
MPQATSGCVVRARLQVMLEEDAVFPHTFNREQKPPASLGLP